jgi:hypothetical protein
MHPDATTVEQRWQWSFGKLFTITKAM